MILSDPSAERAVLSGICKHGEDLYLDIADILSDLTFTIDSNKIIYKCLKDICEKQQLKFIDLASIYYTAKELNLSDIL